MSTLHIAPHFTLPYEALEDVVAILGRRGRGKTTTATVLAEELHRSGARFCVLDPTGVWFGLKSSRDGKHPGIPCVVMGGEHGDVPLAPESGEVIADFVADPASPSCVLDLKLFTQGELVRFAGAFLARLYHKNRATLHLVMDEADQFGPQRPMPGEQAMLGACQRVTKMGRAKGLHPLMVTQRPATLSKSLLTQAGLLIAHAITGPQDRKAVDEWIKANADEGERDTFLAELSSLPRGTAYFWSPDLALFRQVAVRDRTTFDSSATPKRGEKRVEPKALAEVDLEALRSKIAATIEQAKANDPKELRKQVADLRRQLAAQPTAPRVEPERIEVSVLTEADRTKLSDLGYRLDAAAETFQRVGLELQHVVGELAESLAEVRAPLHTLVTRGVPAPVAPPRRAAPAPAPARAASNGSGTHRGDLGNTRQRILDTIAMLDVRGIAKNRDVVARWMDLHPNGSRYNRDLASLRAEGHLDGFELTPAAAPHPMETGLDAALAALPEPSWQQLLTTIVEGKRYEGRDALAAALGLHPNGSRYNRGLARLRLLGVITERGPIAPTEALFR